MKKQPFELIKAANNGDTDAALLSGAGFSAYYVKEKRDGGWICSGWRNQRGRSDLS